MNFKTNNLVFDGNMKNKDLKGVFRFEDILKQVILNFGLNVFNMYFFCYYCLRKLLKKQNRKKKNKCNL